MAVYSEISALMSVYYGAGQINRQIHPKNSQMSCVLLILKWFSSSPHLPNNFIQTQANSSVLIQEKALSWRLPTYILNS